jgi:dolichol-phosphate mannosyltransferase
MSGPVLSVIVPTYNEHANIRLLARSVMDALGDTPFELVVVDDSSPDGTGAAVAQLSSSDPRVRLLSRSRKRGLSSAVFAGVDEAKGEYVCVMDADLSHDPEELPGMLAKAQEGYDVVVGSRYVPGSVFVNQPFVRRLLSLLLNNGARVLLQIGTRDVLTGFVLCRREALARMPTHYSAPGFKWLVELLATQRSVRVTEWPIVFRDRKHGTSKAGVVEAASFGLLCAKLTAWRLRRLARGVLR